MERKPYEAAYPAEKTRSDLARVSSLHVLSFDKFVGDTLGRNGTCRVLDIGSGNSRFLEELAAMFPGAEFHTLDPYSDTERGFDRSKTLPNVHFVQGDGNYLPYQNNMFNLVVATRSVTCDEETASVEELGYIREVGRILKPDGIASIAPEPSDILGTFGLQQIATDEEFNPTFQMKALEYKALQDQKFRLSFREEPARVRIYGQECEYFY